MESRRLQVMVVDDNPVVAERIVGLLAEDPRIAVCDRVESGLLAFARISADRPDAVLMDLEMPGIGGIAAIKRIKALFAPPAIIVVTLHEGPEMRAQAAAAGKKKTEGCLVSYDGTGVLVVKDEKTKKDMTFNVKQASSVLDKEGTVATKNGRKAVLTDLEVNRPVIVYWKDKDGSPFASKVDAPDPIDSETGKLDSDIMEQAGCKME